MTVTPLPGVIVTSVTDVQACLLYTSREAELRAILFRVLTPEELDLTQALLEGFKQREIAENLGVSQQAVAARLRKIRDKLKGIIASM